MKAIIVVFLLGVFYLAKPCHDTAPDTLRKIETLKTEAGQLLSRCYEDEFVLTAYTNHHKCVRKIWLDGKTSNGSVAKVGTVAADLSILPYGTIVYVQSYGIGIVEDTGSAIKGKRLDLFFNSLSEAENWGIQKKTVFIIRPKEE